jgi:hypothetical protein
MLDLLAAALKRGYEQVVALFEWIIANPPSVGQNPLIVFLDGNALGAAPFLATAVMAMTIVLALFWQRGRAAFARALIAFVAVAALSPLWFEFISAFQKLGDNLSNVALGLTNQAPTGAASIIPVLPNMTIEDAFLASLTFGPAAYFGYLLFDTFLAYGYVAAIVAFLGLLSLSLIALGPRARKVFNFLIAVGIVTMVLGRPVAIVCIELGQAFANLFTNTPNSMFILGASTVGSLILALIAQPVLLVLMYQGVSRVGGNINALVTGTVRSLSESRATLSGSTAVQANIASMNGRQQALERAGETFVGGVAAASAAKGAAALAARAAASTTPVGAVAATAGSIAVSQLPKLAKSVGRSTRASK